MPDYPTRAQIVCHLSLLSERDCCVLLGARPCWPPRHEGCQCCHQRSSCYRWNTIMWL